MKTPCRAIKNHLSSKFVFHKSRVFSISELLIERQYTAWYGPCQHAYKDLGENFTRW